jgi:hypothetical protein
MKEVKKKMMMMILLAANGDAIMKRSKEAHWLPNTKEDGVLSAWRWTVFIGCDMLCAGFSSLLSSRWPYLGRV